MKALCGSPGLGHYQYGSHKSWIVVVWTETIYSLEEIARCSASIYLLWWPLGASLPRSLCRSVPLSPPMGSWSFLYNLSIRSHWWPDFYLFIMVFLVYFLCLSFYHHIYLPSGLLFENIVYSYLYIFWIISDLLPILFWTGLLSNSWLLNGRNSHIIPSFIIDKYFLKVNSFILWW